MEIKKTGLFDGGGSEWDESKHPRDDDGKFGSGGGSGDGSSSDKSLTKTSKVGIIKLPPDEYAPFSSSVAEKVHTYKQGNKGIVYGTDPSDKKSYAYQYKYNPKNHKTVCVGKYDVEKEGEYISMLEDEYGSK